MVIIARIFFALLVLLPVMAQAAEPLIFKPAGKDIREQSVLIFLKGHGLDQSQPFTVATIDLNGDGIGEWIVRQDTPNCARDASCPFYIAGLKNKKPVLLGQVAAGKLGITGEKTYGVAKLVVYNDQSNDFTYKSFSWDPFKGAFVLQ